MKYYLTRSQDDVNDQYEFLADEKNISHRDHTQWVKNRCFLATVFYAVNDRNIAESMVNLLKGRIDPDQRRVIIYSIIQENEIDIEAKRAADRFITKYKKEAQKHPKSVKLPIRGVIFCNNQHHLQTAFCTSLPHKEPKKSNARRIPVLPSGNSELSISEGTRPNTVQPANEQTTDSELLIDEYDLSLDECDILAVIYGFEQGGRPLNPLGLYERLLSATVLRSSWEKSKNAFYICLQSLGKKDLIKYGAKYGKKKNKPITVTEAGLGYIARNGILQNKAEREHPPQ